MKTKPLDELLKEITPLPFECYGPSLVAITFDYESSIGPTTDHAGPIAVVSGDNKNQSLLQAAYLTHCANVLPELVEALKRLRSAAIHCDPLFETRWAEASGVANAALKKATTVEMP